MTIDEKLKHIESALTKVRENRVRFDINGEPTRLTPAEASATAAALQIAAAICELFKGR